jgi:hypothetical protein
MDWSRKGWIDVCLQLVLFYAVDCSFVLMGNEGFTQVFLLGMVMTAFCVSLHFLRKTVKSFVMFFVLSIFAAALSFPAFFVVFKYSFRFEMEMCVASVMFCILTYFMYSCAVWLNKTEQSDKEHLSRSGFLIVFLYFYSRIKNNDVCVMVEMCMLLVFVLLQFVYHYYEIYGGLQKQYGKNAYFPSRQLELVGKMQIFLVCAILILCTLFFYYGPYGNLELQILKLLKYLLLLPLSLIFREGSVLPDPESTEEETFSTEWESIPTAMVQTVEQTTQQAEEKAGSAVSLDLFFSLLIYVAIAGIALFIIYKIYRFWKRIRGTYRSGSDVMESWKREAAQPMRKISYDETHEEYTDLKNAERIRRLYRHAVRSAVRKEKIISAAALPRDITKEYIEPYDESLESCEITRIYEKARYSKEQITEREVEYMMKVKGK